MKRPKDVNKARAGASKSAGGILARVQEKRKAHGAGLGAAPWALDFPVPPESHCIRSAHPSVTAFVERRSYIRRR